MLKVFEKSNVQVLHHGHFAMCNSDSFKIWKKVFKLIRQKFDNLWLNVEHFSFFLVELCWIYIINSGDRLILFGDNQIFHWTFLSSSDVKPERVFLKLTVQIQALTIWENFQQQNNFKDREESENSRIDSGINIFSIEQSYFIF